MADVSSQNIGILRFLTAFNQYNIFIFIMTWQCYGNQSIKLLIHAFSCVCSQENWKTVKKLLSCSQLHLKQLQIKHFFHVLQTFHRA